MVRLLTVSDVAKLVKTIGLQRFISELMVYMHDDFIQWPTFQHSPRVSHPVSHGVMELMPTCSSALYAVKYVNGHPSNPSRQCLTVTGLGMLADTQTGYPLMISEMTVLTAIRTAATSALASSVLAPKSVNQLAQIGCGAQSEFQVIALASTHDVHRVTLFDINEQAAEKCARNVADFGIEAVIAKRVEDVVAQADIITTATAQATHQSLVPLSALKRPVHINAIGGDCPGKTEWDAKLLQQARVVVEYLPQTQVEGEIQHQQDHSAVTELWRILSGEAPGRQGDELTVFDSVGFALEDYSTLRYVYDQANRYQIGSEQDLIPTGAVHDLYQHIRADECVS